MSDDLAAWLRIQLDDDERVARAAVGAFSVTDADQAPIWPDYVTYGDTDELAAAEAYLGVFRPHRELAEVDAKRRILDAYDQTEFGDFTRRTALEEAITALALPYADRPGYRDEWRPE